MHNVTDLPHETEVWEDGIWIPLSSGHRLAARIILPVDAQEKPVPALLEYIPYRKRDMTRIKDEPAHGYLAGHGYAAVRVDLRGAGDSFGVMRDEYTEQELSDAVEVIAWLAEQSWCTGKVGMFGISWGGFNSLQVAARRPPALKAIITSCSTDDRYTDDMHYMGGCLLNDNMDWGTTFFSILPLPGDPAIMGEGWRDNWMERLEAMHCPIETWLRHPWRDDYWKHGSINEDYSAISCPVFAVGGWLDGYSNAIFRMLSNLKVPRLGLVGPHGHQWGQADRAPGPAIGFLQEALRWWDHWLKEEETGIMDEPMLRVIMQEDLPARPWYADCPGEWVGEAQWPSPRITPLVLHLHEEGLRDEAGPVVQRINVSPQTCGLDGGEWCPYGTGGTGPEFPGDQRFDDGASLVFDSLPLEETLEILGAPSVDLDLAVDQPSAFIAVRLNDVKPDGSIARATFGILNLAHRDGHEAPQAMVPGQRTKVRIQLNDTAYRFLPGHRVRVSVSTTYWPMIWPSPEAVTLSLFTGAGQLTLPVRSPEAREDHAIRFESPEEARPLAVTVMEPSRQMNRMERDILTGRIDVLAERGSGLARLEDSGLVIGYRNSVERMSIVEGDPLSCETEMVFENRLGRDSGFDIRIRAATKLRSTKEEFLLSASLDVWEAQEEVYSRTWDHKIPRKLV